MKTRSGKIEFITGTMYSGKTSRLITEAKILQGHGAKLVVLKPTVDSRHEKCIVRSQIGTEIQCDYNIIESTNIIKDISLENADYIFVDEVQFLTTEHINQFRAIADDKGIDIFMYGLKTTFLRELFPCVKRIFELADKITILKAPCGICKVDLANTNLRLGRNNEASTSGNVVEIDNGNSGYTYVQACHKCWTEKTAKNN